MSHHHPITHDNSFVPLMDGVISAQHGDKSLLEAEVNRIVDSLSLGWYESMDVPVILGQKKVRRSIRVIGNVSHHLGHPDLSR